MKVPKFPQIWPPGGLSIQGIWFEGSHHFPLPGVLSGVETFGDMQ